MLHCSYIYSSLLARLIVAQTLCLACSSEIFFFLNTPLDAWIHWRGSPFQFSPVHLLW